MGPWATNEERRVSEALASAQSMTAEQISMIRPPLSQIQLFPPKYGYRIEALGIHDFAYLDQIYPAVRRDWTASTSGSGYQGTGYPALGVS